VKVFTKLLHTESLRTVNRGKPASMSVDQIITWCGIFSAFDRVATIGCGPSLQVPSGIVNNNTFTSNFKERGVNQL